jgi:type II secretory pathway component PulF
MIRFRFKAKSKEGVTRKGIVEAQSLASAANVLREQGLVIVELHELSASGSLF